VKRENGEACSLGNSPCLTNIPDINVSIAGVSANSETGKEEAYSPAQGPPYGINNIKPHLSHPSRNNNINPHSLTPMGPGRA